MSSKLSTQFQIFSSDFFKNLTEDLDASESESNNCRVLLIVIRRIIMFWKIKIT